MEDITIGKSFEELPERGYLSPFVQDLIINSAEKNLSLYSKRFIAILSMNLKEKQFLRTKKGFGQLELFDELTDFSKDSGLTYDFSFKYSDFLPKGDKNYKNVKNAIKELQTNLYSIQFTKIDKKGKETTYNLSSQLISGFITDNKQGFKIAINAYWYRSLVNLTSNYNSFLKDVIFHLTENGLIFYFYLQTLPIIKEKDISAYLNIIPEQYSLRPELLKGTVKDTSDIINLMATNRGLTKRSQIENRILEPLKQEIGQYTNLGFNYRLDGKNTSLVTFPKSHKQEVRGEEQGMLKVKSSFKYQLEKAKLDVIQANFLKEIYSKYPYEIINKATSRKSQLRNLKGKEFVDMFNSLILIYTQKYKKIELIYNADEQKRSIRAELSLLLNNETYFSSEV